MKTITANIKEGIDQEIITEAGSILKDGGLVAFPTETYTDLAAMHWMNRRRRKFTLRREDLPTILLSYILQNLKH